MQTIPPKKTPKTGGRGGRLSLFLLVVFIELSGDFNLTKNPNNNNRASRSQLFSVVQVVGGDSYGDLVSGSSPAIEAALQDDDDDEDAELDTAASGPDEADGDDEDSYGADADAPRPPPSRPPTGNPLGADEDGDGDRQDSRLHELWTRPSGRRVKRELEFARKLTAGRPIKPAGAGSGPGTNRERSDNGNKDEDFAIDDGDEDAWVHDGIDDIHIDPETKRAANELSRDTEQSSLDAEYDPSTLSSGHSTGQQHGQQATSASQPAIVNRTRVTTIAEVIPLTRDEAGELEDADDSTIRLARTGRPPARMLANALPATNYLPAAYLSLDQVQALIDRQQRHQQQMAARRHDQDHDDDFDDSGRLQGHLRRPPIAGQRDEALADAD